MTKKRASAPKSTPAKGKVSPPADAAPTPEPASLPMAQLGVHGYAIERRPLDSLTPNENNPRVIRQLEFQRLKQSIRDFPQMLEMRPLIVTAEGVILAGNMRYRAAKELGLQEVFVIQVADLTEADQLQVIVKDNVSAGSWDWKALADKWDHAKLQSWGVPAWSSGKTGTQAKFDRQVEEGYTRVPTMVFGKNKAPMTAEEFAELNNAFKAFVDDRGTPVGFVTHLLQLEPTD